MGVAKWHIRHRNVAADFVRLGDRDIFVSQRRPANQPEGFITDNHAIVKSLADRISSQTNRVRVARCVDHN